MLVDTDVIIWHMRGSEKARRVLDQGDFSISVITYMELVQGMRNKQELQSLRRALRGWQTKVLYLSEEISGKALIYVEKHFLSHSLRLADALIAATAITCDLPLLTGNDKHYRVIKELTVKVFRPR